MKLNYWQTIYREPKTTISDITQYNSFINEGEQFYQKFETILNSYENEKNCESKLPLAYKKLKSEIKVAIDKFNVTYQFVKVKVSKIVFFWFGINGFQKKYNFAS